MKSILFILVFLMTFSGIIACDCVNEIDSVKTSFLLSDIAFKGKVIIIERIANNDTILEINETGDTTTIIKIDRNSYFNYTIVVFDSYKKTIESDTIVIQGPAYTSCEANLAIEGIYFVFANLTKSRTYITNYCSGNKEFNPTDEKILNRMKIN